MPHNTSILKTLILYLKTTQEHLQHQKYTKIYKSNKKMTCKTIQQKTKTNIKRTFKNKHVKQ